MSRLSREDWAKAALRVISEQGVSGLAVERLAVELHTTKGSFYWHFGSRAELVTAALEIWEQRSTSDVIDRVEAAAGDPRERLRALFEIVFEPSALTGADVSLLAHAGEDLVRESVERVTRRRIAYIIELLRAAGLAPALARRRAVLAYSAYLGHLHLTRHAPNLVEETVGSSRRYLDDVLRTMLAP